MSLIDEHRAARKDSSLAVMHEFKLRFKRGSKTIYGFVEGKDDPCFYRGFVESRIPSEWKTELWPSGNKDCVISLFEKFDWRVFNKQQVLFFVDRDLSEFTNEPTPVSDNFYVTDNYSIENDVVNSNVCDRLLREICGFSHMKYDDSDKIISQFDSQLNAFQSAMIPVMSNIVYWRNNNLKACLDDIIMKHMFSIKKGKLVQKSNPKNKANEIVYIHEQCNLPVQNHPEINTTIVKYKNENLEKKFIRGKYILWFAVEYCISIHRDCLTLDFVNIADKPKVGINLSQSNGISQIAPRCRMPVSLSDFFDKTLNEYVKKIAA